MRDRVVQTAATADPGAHLRGGFPGLLVRVSAGPARARGAARSLRSVREGYTAIYDADLQAYFDSIPHDKLMQCVERRVADRSVLRLLRLWLTAPVEERDENGRPRAAPADPRDAAGRGDLAAAGEPYLHWIDVVFHRRQGPEHVGEGAAGPATRMTS